MPAVIYGDQFETWVLEKYGMVVGRIGNERVVLGLNQQRRNADVLEELV